jgi:hypothetical protein
LFLSTNQNTSIAILEDYGQFQRFHYLNTLVTENPILFDEKDPYKRFLRFHWSFTPEGNHNPTLEEKVEAQKIFSFMVMDFTRILCRNFYKGIGRKFNSQIHDFSVFILQSNEIILQKLKS